MPLKGSNKTKYQREYMKTKRSSIEQGITQYPAILYALTDPVKRAKLEKIYESLRTFKQEKNVYLGWFSMPFDMVGEYLEATR